MKLKKKIKKYGLLTVILVVLALIILPTGTPEDFVTSLPLYLKLGATNFFLLCAGIIFLLFLFGGKVWLLFKSMLK